MVSDERIQREVVDANTIFRLTGNWSTASLALLEDEVRYIVAAASSITSPLKIDASEIESIDTNGAWLLSQFVQAFEQHGVAIQHIGLNDEHLSLFGHIHCVQPSLQTPQQLMGLSIFAERLGQTVLDGIQNGLGFVSFLGLTIVKMLWALAQPRRFRFTSFVHHLGRTGIDSLPIVAMLAFLIGVVLAYMSGEQLKNFGVESYTVDLVAASILREMGILITAIIIAGRSGSAFTAQIGTMKVNQEIDAMNTIGLDPVEFLVLPRVAALIISLSLLTFFANVMGLFGGAVIAVAVLDMSIPEFIVQLKSAVNLNDFLVGVAKAPLFGFIIALVGCYEGFRVSSSAESVGLQTTRSVVESIALVIVIDTMFVVFFSVVGI